MAEKDSTTKTPPEERQTYQNKLVDAISLIMVPLEDFQDLMDYETEGDTGRIMRVLKELLERQKQELEKIYEAIDRTLGQLSLEYPMYDEYVKFEGRTYKYPEIIRAVLEPVKPQAAGPGGEA